MHHHPNRNNPPRHYQSQPTVYNPPSIPPPQPVLHPSNISPPKNNISKFNCRDGPTEKQKPTDCYCTAIYLLLLITSITLILIFQESSVSKFQNPFNHRHKPCQKEEYLLYLPGTPTVCVKNCSAYNDIQFLSSQNHSSSMYPSLPPHLKQDKLLSLCFKYEFMKHNITISPLTLIIRSISHYSNVIFIVLSFVLVYSGLMLFTNILLANSIVYIWIGVIESMTMIIASSCFYRYYTLATGIITNSPFELKNKHYFLVFGVIFSFMFIFGMLGIVKKKKYLKHIVDLIKLARGMWMENEYLIWVALVQLVIGLGSVYLLGKMMVIGLSFGYLDYTKAGPYDQIKPHPVRYFLFPLTLLVFIWTYLICINTSRFLLNCITIQWYFNEKLKGREYSKLDNLVESIKLLYVHFGTVCYASLLSIFPRWLFKCINYIKGSTNIGLYQNPLFNIAICSCCKYLSVYSHTYVILRSHQFQRANRECCSLLDDVKSDTPQLYDLGDSYSRSAITFFLLFAFGFSYYAIILKQSRSIDSFVSLFAPIVVVVLCTLMVSVMLLSYLGFVGDIIVMMYQLDRKESEEGMRDGVGREMSAPEGIREIMEGIENRVEEEG